MKYSLCMCLVFREGLTRESKGRGYFDLAQSSVNSQLVAFKVILPDCHLWMVLYVHLLQ